MPGGVQGSTLLPAFPTFVGGRLLGMLKFLFGQDNRSRAQRDQYRPSVIGKNLVSPINDYGTCFGCEGTGQRTLECRACHGSGEHTGTCRACEGTGKHERPAKPCFGCSGTGTKFGNTCQRCSGTGEFKPAISETCRKCSGTGTHSSTCRKCSGSGSFTVQCRRCSGSGWRRF